MRLSALNGAAYTRGLQPGQGVAEARAMCPELDVVAADQTADQQLLEALADWVDCYTPLVGCDGPDGLFLDIAGCAHLFGGEGALLADCLARLHHLGFAAQGAIAPAPSLAWALARHDPHRISSTEDMAACLPGLPVSALRLTPDITAALCRVGLKKLGDLLTAPRAPLARRFGAVLLNKLDRITGRENEPISPRRPVPELMAERRFAEPLTDIGSIGILVGRLAETLKELLTARGAGLRQAELSLFRLDGVVRRIAVGTARPVRDPTHLKRLFAEKLSSLHEEIDTGYGFELIRLSALVFEPLDDTQTDFDHRLHDEGGFHTLADRLAARLGQDRVLLPVALNRHIPERALAHVPHADATMAISGQVTKPEHQPDPFLSASGSPRPLRLFCHPEPVTAVAEVPEGPPVTFRWRNSPHRVARAEGPERMAAEWWLDGEAAPSRDYYRVEDEAGRRYWLFRQGLYERETDNPRWFLHGLFA